MGNGHLPSDLDHGTFRASCVLLSAMPVSPLSQPVHVIAGHLTCASVRLAAHFCRPESRWVVALAVGLSITAMVVLRVTHPPAGANLLVVFASDPGLGFLVFPVFSGALTLVAVACHRLTGKTYPKRSD
ncbi:HPP family protein [Paracoccus jiaweipingae]|uniref:HPP family protein n=1 Tax=unclassified Paracoccus (in: a-proteobacteria) TaxID=2688777 RepID=UPI003799B96E